MDTPTHQQIRAWLEREIALGLESVPRGIPAEAGITALESSDAAFRPEPAKSRLVESSRANPDSAAPPVGTPAPPRFEERPAITPSVSPIAADILVEPEIRVADSLAALREVLGDCRRCKLCKGRTNIVYGVGNPSARLMFVGEGPGEDEDKKGEPFVGKAGELLTTIITNGMGLTRSDVYIANVVKCRPPNNRDPEPDEIVACEPFLKRQVDLVAPEVIVSLGKFATQALLGDRTPISKRRGHWHEYQGRPLMPTFHPAYLLRNPSDKGLVWSDIKLVMERLGLPLPPPRSGRRQ